MVGMLSTIVPNQPACLHTPLALKKERGKKTMGDTIARPVVNYVSLTPATMHCSQDQPTCREGFLITGRLTRNPDLVGKLGVCDPSGASLTPYDQGNNLPRLTRNTAAKRSLSSPFFHGKAHLEMDQRSPTRRGMRMSALATRPCLLSCCLRSVRIGS